MIWVEYFRGWFLSKEAYGLTTLMAIVGISSLLTVASVNLSCSGIGSPTSSRKTPSTTRKARVSKNTTYIPHNRRPQGL